MSDQKQAIHKEDRELVTIAGAAALIMQYPSIVAPCRVSLHGALGMVLAEDCRASFDLPPHDHAAMDGYAFRAADASHGRLRVCGFLPAGSSMQLEVPQGEAVRIMTGDSASRASAPTTLSNTIFTTMSQSAMGLSNTSSTGTAPM